MDEFKADTSAIREATAALDALATAAVDAKKALVALFAAEPAIISVSVDHDGKRREGLAGFRWPSQRS